MNDGSASSPPPAPDDYVASRTATIQLDDGGTVMVRPATPADRPALLEGLGRLSPRSVYLRFLRPMPKLTEAELTQLLSVDQHDHVAWAAFDEQGGPVGIARYVRDKDRPAYAEAAITVIDEHQRRGVGTILAQLLARSAAENGIEHFIGFVANENQVLIDQLTEAGARLVEADEHAKTFEVDLPLPDRFDDSALRAALAAVAQP